MALDLAFSQDAPPDPQAQGVAPQIAAAPPQAQAAIAANAPPSAPTTPIASMMSTPDDTLRMAAKAHPWVTALRLLGATLGDAGLGMRGQEGSALAGVRSDIYNQAMIPVQAQMMQQFMGGGQPQQGQPSAQGPQTMQPAQSGQQPQLSPAAQLLQQQAGQRRMLAFQALRAGHPDQAYVIMRPDMQIDRTSNHMYDSTTGQDYGQLGVDLQVGPDGVPFDPHDPTNAGVNMQKPPVDGAQPLFGPQGYQGGVQGWRMADGSVQAIQASEQAKSQGTAQGAATVSDPRTLITIPDPDHPGATKVITQGQLAGMTGGPASGAPLTSGGAPASAGGSLGGTASVADTAFAEGEAKDLSGRIGELIDAREPAIQQRANALQTQGFALSHAMNPATPWKVGAANYLRTVPSSMLTAIGMDPAKISDYANDASSFSRLTNQVTLQAARTLLPNRYTERELKLVPPITGSLSTPNEAMEMASGVQAAIAGRQKSQADFASTYNGPKSRQAFEAAWAASPQGQRSIFQDPEAWSHVTIHGKPAVIYSPDGKWGAFALGTPQAYKFRVQ